MEVILAALIFLCGENTICKLEAQKCMAPFRQHEVKEVPEAIQSEIFDHCFNE